MKIIVRNFFALTLFVIQTARSKCNLHKEVADCSNTNLNQMPTLNNTNFIEVLQLDNNSLRELNVTSLNQFVSLKNLSIRGNDLTEIRDFSYVRNLVYMDLSENELETLPQNLLKGCSKLQYLSLSQNKLQTLERFQFSQLTSLEILDLSNNRISLVHDETFHGLGLKTLLLNNNKLKTLFQTPFLHLTGIQTLDLSGNPWQCDCDLRQLRDMLVHRQLQGVEGSPVLCEEPERFAGSDWRTISSQEFACPPTTEVNVQHIQAIAGQDQAIECRIKGSPAPAVRWLHNETLMGGESEAFLLLETAVSLQEIRSELVLTNLTNTRSGLYTCVAINNAGVSAASTNLSVVHLSFIYRFSWEFWFLVLLTFLLVFFMFVGLICKTICRARQVEQNKKEETNTEVLFQYSENFLRESDHFPASPEETPTKYKLKVEVQEQDCPQFEVFRSSFRQPSPRLFSLQQKLDQSPGEQKIKLGSGLVEQEKPDRHHKKSSKVISKKVPPPTLPKPKFHPSFLTRQDINVNYVMAFPTYDQKF